MRSSMTADNAAVVPYAGRQPPQLLAGGGVDAHRLLGGVAERDQGRAEPVGLVPAVAHQVVGLGEGGDDAQAGGLGQAEPAGQFGESEPVVGMTGQEVEHGHHALGRG